MINSILAQPPPRLRSTLLLASFSALLAIGQSASASLTYGFSQITSNGNTPSQSQYSVTVYGPSPTDPDPLPQFLIDAGVSLGANQVIFVFRNDGSVASSITDVYFQDGTLLALSSIYSSTGVSFTDPATPGDLPAGNNISPPFTTTGDFSADSTAPNVSASGVNNNTSTPGTGEWVGILFDLQGTQTYANVIAALAQGASAATVSGPPGNPTVNMNGGLRIGIHVQSIGTKGGSESFVNTSVVPEPGNIALAITGLATLSLVRLARRRRS